jgi:hypothetical protein
MAGCEADRQTPTRHVYRVRERDPRGSGIPLRRAGQADSRVQTAALERPLHRVALSAVEGGLQPERCATHVHLWRQSGASIWVREADDPLRQRRRRCRERRSRHARPTVGGLPSRLQRTTGPARLSCSRSLRADLDRRTGGVWHGKHEVRHERRRHHRDVGRGER